MSWLREQHSAPSKKNAIILGSFAGSATTAHAVLALNIDRAKRMAKQTKKTNKTAIVFATHKFIGQKELTEMGITFVQFPYCINEGA